MKKKLKQLDYHEGFSGNQVQIILKELGLDHKKFEEWIGGQTCPMVVRHNDKGERIQVCGYYEYDIFRWIENQKKGTPLIFD